jgi:6-phosphogluconolactonase
MHTMINPGESAPVSRRQFMKSVAAAAMAPGALGASAGGASPQERIAFVGTYTNAVGNLGNGEGIYAFDFNPLTGELSSRRLVAKTPSPSWISVHPSRKYLYAANEVADFKGNSGSVSSFAIDSVTGALTPINTVSSEGAGPAYLSIDATGRFAFVANYGGGSIAVLPVLPSGALGSATDVHRDSDSLGAAQAKNAPQGSFAISGHDAPHAHMIAPDPQRRFVLATDLGQDRIYVYRLDASTGKLIPATTPFIELPSGDGPRHFAFHPNGHWLYSIQEEASTVVSFAYDSSTGAFASHQTVSTLPPGFAGTSFASEILISADGRFLYAANRLHDTIAVFSIGGDGTLRRIGETSTMGDYPSQCRIDPTGNFLFACNRRSDSFTSFRINRNTGLLTFTGSYTAVGSPGSITFL